MSLAADLVGNTLIEAGVTFFTGVPDSLMQPFCDWVIGLPPSQHLMQANEGTAVAMAAGHALDGQGLAVVYLQNSGIGNLVNPLLSLAAPEVYGLPMVLLVGWRGAPGQKDEPQHMLQGKLMPALLDALQVPWAALAEDDDAALAQIQALPQQAREAQRPVVLLVAPGRIGSASVAAPAEDNADPTLLLREAAIAAVLDALPADTWYVATTGKTARELYAQRVVRGETHDRDFYVVGSMGHASSIALGLHHRASGRTICCLDGDGAALMHLGGLALTAGHAAAGYVHILFNNGVHESVGGQPLPVSAQVWCPTAQALGFAAPQTARDADQIQGALSSCDAGGATFLEILVRPGSRADLPRPKEAPRDRLLAFQAAWSRA